MLRNAYIDPGDVPVIPSSHGIRTSDCGKRAQPSNVSRKFSFLIALIKCALMIPMPLLETTTRLESSAPRLMLGQEECPQDSRYSREVRRTSAYFFAFLDSFLVCFQIDITSIPDCNGLDEYPLFWSVFDVADDIDPGTEF